MSHPQLISGGKIGDIYARTTWNKLPKTKGKAWHMNEFCSQQKKLFVYGV